MSAGTVSTTASLRPGGEELVRLAAVVEATPDLVATMDREGRLLYLNSAGRRLLALEADAPLTLNLADLAPNPRTAQVLLEALADTFRTGNWHTEAVLLRRDTGQETPVSVVMFAHQQEDGTTRHVSAIFRDIYERKRIENALRASQQRMRAVIESAPNALVTMSEDGRIADWNPMAEQIFGRTREEVIGRPLDEVIIPPKFRQAHRAGLARFLATGQSQMLGKTLEVNALDREGREFPVEICVTPIALGGSYLFSAFVTDVRERHKFVADLQESEARKGAILRSVLDCLISVDHEGRIIELNPAAEATLGYPRDELLGKDFVETLFHTDAGEMTVRWMVEALRGSSEGVIGKRVETVARRSDGTEFPVELAVSSTLGLHGPMFTIYLRDITERKRSEEALRESERRFRQLAESVTEVFWMASADGREILYASPAFEKIWGRPVQELYDHPLERINYVLPEDRPHLGDALFRSGFESEFDQTYRIVRPDGTVRWIRDRGYPVRDEQGRVYRYAGIAEDITERRRVEEALKDSEALYHSLVDHLPVNVSRKDTEGRFTFANRRVLETLGMSLDQLVGLTDYDLFPRDLADKYRADDRWVMETRKTFECVEEHVDPGQGRTYVQVLKTPVFDSQGRVIGTQVIWWDVTDKKRAEDELKRTAEELARSNRELEQFAYVASHDLQEPLRMVASYVQLLERRCKDKLDGDAAEFIGYAVDGALRMQRLISDLLTYARVGSRGRPFQQVSLEKVFAEATMNLRAAIKAEGATVTHDPLPSVAGDHGQLVQLLQNLIGNAIKFHGGRPSHVHVSASREPRGWRIAVRDNGIGFDPQFKDKIFGVFQRLHGKGEYPGTGIGLAICKKIVERHQGQIGAESTPGQGSEFWFVIPDAPEKSMGHRE